MRGAAAQLLSKLAAQLGQSLAGGDSGQQASGWQPDELAGRLLRRLVQLAAGEGDCAYATSACEAVLQDLLGAAPAR
jgi:hypothetical protein